MEPKQGIITLYKEQGETPLECLERWRGTDPDRQGVALTYLGRLDPMAEGVLLVAVGEENKNREKYLGLDKEYEFDVLFGFQTDSYDLLGVAENFGNNVFAQNELSQGEILQENIISKVLSLRGKQIQQYPPYSSRTVQGKPLWMWAREGRLIEIEIPTIEIEIYDLKELETREISKEELLKEIESKIAKVKGDFRQAGSIASWKKVLAENSQNFYTVGSFWIKCSSGTYVRSLANDLGGVAYRIKRTKIVE